MRKLAMAVVVVMFGTGGLVGCGSDDGDSGLEIIGSYTDEWQGQHVISEENWDMSGSIFHIVAMDNDKDFLIAQNDAANEYNPSLWSRFDWTTADNGDLYYCQIAYDAASQEAATGTNSANSADMAAGCNGFGWSKLIPKS